MRVLRPTRGRAGVEEAEADAGLQFQYNVAGYCGETQEAARAPYAAARCARILFGVFQNLIDQPNLPRIINGSYFLSKNGSFEISKFPDIALKNKLNSDACLFDVLIAAIDAGMDKPLTPGWKLEVGAECGVLSSRTVSKDSLVYADWNSDVRFSPRFVLIFFELKMLVSVR